MSSELWKMLTIRYCLKKRAVILSLTGVKCRMLFLRIIQCFMGLVSSEIIVSPANLEVQVFVAQWGEFITTVYKSPTNNPAKCPAASDG